jgi:P-loop Domain of unknown function (DUF2791)
VSWAEPEAVAADVSARRALEALRAGVPSRDAVRVLGSQQPHVEDRFRRQLESAPADIAAGRHTPGLLIGGDFGTGKSHLLAHLQHVALGEGFVCSRVVISKETPLYDPARLYRSAIRAAVVPGRKGSAVTELAARLEPEDPRVAALVHWVSRPDVGLSSRFAATLFLLLRERNLEVRDRVTAYWSGDPLSVGQVRGWLRAHGEAATYGLEKVAAAELALQRFAFLPRLAIAAGYAGWVLLLDEVELIGRYSFKQRARSYAELARWSGKLKDAGVPGLVTVSAITTDFDAAVLHERNDLEVIPGRLRASEREADLRLASQAEHGMRFIGRDVVRLKGLDRASLDRVHHQVRELYTQVYRWEAPDNDDEHSAGERLSTTRLRQYVRRWINAWDLRRLYPSYAGGDTVIEALAPDYSEAPELEVSDESTVADQT